MSFTDITFIARFLPIFLPVYYIAPNRWRDPILFIGSLIFYAFGEPRMVFMLLLLVIANYLMGRVLVKPRGVMEEGLPELDENGNIVIGDEMLTPDSSRFWPAKGYEPGHGQPSFDKQFARDWLKDNEGKHDWELPADIAQKTIDKYLEAYQLLTGTPLDK